MKTTLTLVALALASSVVAAQTTPAKQTDRSTLRTLPAYVDGSEYEQALTMFMSQKTREQVRAETIAALRKGFNSYDYLVEMGGTN